PNVQCTCSAQRLARYRDKLSRALLDRFDLGVTVPRPRAIELQDGPAEESASVRERVLAARKRLRQPLRRTKDADALLTRAAGLRPRPRGALVGARAGSPHGGQVARMLGRALAASGGVVVSGLARGTDGEAHRGALDTDGHTVAVLGCGIDSDYPAAHASLAR